MIDLGQGISGQDGEGFTEAGGKPMPPLGWGEFAIMDQKEHDGNLIIMTQNKAGESCDLFLGFAGSEDWQVKQARATLGKVIQSTGFQGVIKTQQDIANLTGLKMDIKISHANSKKLKDDGTPFRNARAKNFAPAGTKSSVAVPAATDADAPPQSAKKDNWF